MYLRGTMEVGSNGHLFIGGCDTVELTQKYGTPLYVLDEALIRQQCRRYRAGFASHYPNSTVVYAGKAFLTTAMCRIIDQEGLSLDVVSGGELYTALTAGFPPDRIVFHGNNKSASELKMALSAGVGRIVVDNDYEIHLLESLAARLGLRTNVLLRITPGVEAHTHAYIQTGQIDTKFGFGLIGGIARTAVARVMASPYLKLRGLHCHVGSQIFSLDSFAVAIDAMFDFLAELKRDLGFVAQELDLGGGLGIRYVEGDAPPDPLEFARFVAVNVKKACAERELPAPQILCEPGRSIVGEAGTTLYTVGAIKKIPGVRTYVAVDGGMTDNPRVALYQAKYEACVANKASTPATQTVSIAGKCCESGDMLIWDAMLPPVEPGDTIAVFSTGAYNYSMSSNYNRLPRPAVVLVTEGHSDIIVRRERYADLVAHDVIPTRLGPPATEEAAAAHEERSA